MIQIIEEPEEEILSVVENDYDIITDTKKNIENKTIIAGRFAFNIKIESDK